MTTACALAILVMSEGCNIYACTYETRFVSLRGTASSSGVGLVTVESLGFRQYRPEQAVSNSVSYVARGEGLAAAPTSLELWDQRNGARLVATLGMSTSATSFSAASGFEVPVGGREEMFQLLSGGQAQIILRLSNGTSMVVPLAIASQEDWHRPDCG